MEPAKSKRYGTDEKCGTALAVARWPEGFECPRCQGRSAYSFCRGRQPYQQCFDCGYQCSLIAETIFEATKLPLTRWLMAFQLLTQARNNVSALKLMRQRIRRREDDDGAHGPLDRLTRHCHIVETGNESIRFSRSTAEALKAHQGPRAGPQGLQASG